MPYFDESLRYSKDTAYHVVGGKSNQYPFEKYQKVFPQITKDKVVIVPDAGHWVHFDKPEETIKLISSFLDDIDKK